MPLVTLLCAQHQGIILLTPCRASHLRCREWITRSDRQKRGYATPTGHGFETPLLHLQDLATVKPNSVGMDKKTKCISDTPAHYCSVRFAPLGVWTLTSKLRRLRKAHFGTAFATPRLNDYKGGFGMVVTKGTRWNYSGFR